MEIVSLASAIKDGTDKIAAYHKEHDLAEHWFDESASRSYAYPPDVERARLEAIAASSELRVLLGGPQSLLWDSGAVNASGYAIRALVYRFRLAKHVSLGSGTSYIQIARSCGLAEDAVKRIIKAAATERIFKIDEHGLVWHTASSRALHEDHLLDQQLGASLQDMCLSTFHLADALDRWPGSGDPNHTGFNIAYNTHLPFFEYLSANPKRATRFADAMSSVQRIYQKDIVYLVEEYPWSELGLGTKLVDLLRKYEHLSAVVQDKAEVIGESRIPEDLGSRLSFQSHEFFERQTEEADAYLLRWILHDWSDEYAAKILRAVVPALKTTSRILINDRIVPKPGVLPLGQERSIRFFDLRMWAFHNGKERELDQWEDLLAMADPRLRINRVFNSSSVSLGILEVVLENKSEKA